jgi:hypothetical protein
MWIALIVAVICWFIFKKIWLSILLFYFITGIRKSRMWLSIRKIHLPPLLWKQNLGSFMYGVLLWPIVLIGCGGDPTYQYFREMERRARENQINSETPES